MSDEWYRANHGAAPPWKDQLFPSFSIVQDVETSFCGTTEAFGGETLTFDDRCNEVPIATSQGRASFQLADATRAALASVGADEMKVRRT